MYTVHTFVRIRVQIRTENPQNFIHDILVF